MSSSVARAKRLPGVGPLSSNVRPHNQDPSEGIFSLTDLSSLLDVLEQSGPPKNPPVTRAKDERFVFAAMPFAPEFDDVFLVAMTHAANEMGVDCKRVDREDFDGDIVEELKRLISSCVAVIADLSNARPNVLYELGYAHGLGKPCVLLTSSPTSDLPFDVRNWNVMKYTKGQTSHLRDPLAKRLRAVAGEA